MAKKCLNRERAAEVLVDAHFIGVAGAARKWDIHDRTVQNYRARLANDVELTRLFAEQLEKASTEWHDERLKFLKVALAKLDELVAKADSPAHIAAVANAVKVVGELQVAEGVLGGHSPAQPRPVPAAPAGDDDGSEDGGPDPADSH